MYCGYITTIEGLRKHSNADRLQCATIFGNNVIVDLTFSERERVVYFPTDGQLSEEFAVSNNLVRKMDSFGRNIGGYLDPDKRNITAIKLRGEKSDGLVLKLSVLEKYTDISKLADGERISVLNGKEICKKYIPKSNRSESVCGTMDKPLKKSKTSSSYPQFFEHKDTAQLAYNKNAFMQGDTIYLTQKLHGTSFRVSNTVKVTKKERPWWIKRLFGVQDKVEKHYSVVSGTRRTVLDSDGSWGSNEFRKKYNTLFDGRLPKGMTVYGEIVGWVNNETPIMPRCNNSRMKDKEFLKMYGDETVFTYGCKSGENKCFIYRITVTNEDNVTIELPTEDVMNWCKKLGVNYVPLLEKFIYTTWEDLNERCNKYLDIPEPLSGGAHVTEGVVVRIDNRPTFTAYKAKSFSFKVLEGIIKDSATAPDIEEEEELITNERK